jgi:hypothetical protein
MVFTGPSTRRPPALSRMQDIAGVRVVVPALELQEFLVGVVMDLYADCAPRAPKDTREEADETGYRAVHIVITLDERLAENSGSNTELGRVGPDHRGRRRPQRVGSQARGWAGGVASVVPGDQRRIPKGRPRPAVQPPTVPPMIRLRRPTNEPVPSHIPSPQARPPRVTELVQEGRWSAW